MSSSRRGAPGDVTSGDLSRAPRRALLSVANKAGIVEFARALEALSYEILSTGGTAAALRAAGVAVTDVAAVTRFPEMMDGRVKTLHPHIHGGLLARVGTDDAALATHGIGLIDVLAVNLYPFEETVKRPDCTDDEAIENIDVGGPAMLRAAAKNHERVTVVVDPADYAQVAESLRTGGASEAQRRALAAKAFAHTARYDAAICRYLRSYDTSPAPWPDPLIASWQLAQPLRYGENPHQTAALYTDADAAPATLARATQLQGKDLSYNNLVDADAALEAVMAFDGVACVIVKHANPCGIAVAPTPAAAYDAAHRCDPESAFGGIIALNRALDAATADAIVTRQFAEVIVAPEVAKGALAALARKPNIRVLEVGWPASEPPYAARDVWQIKAISGGALLQQRDSGSVDLSHAKIVTRRAPTEAELRDLKFAWQAVKFVKSNAIVYARDGATVGIGAGQPSRVMSAKIGALKAAERGLELKGSVLASDAFFPFRDGIDAAAANGVAAIVQPGGSLKDDEVVRAADEHGIAMVLTGMRHFRH